MTQTLLYLKNVTELAENLKICYYISVTRCYMNNEDGRKPIYDLPCYPCELAWYGPLKFVYWHKILWGRIYPEPPLVSRWGPWCTTLVHWCTICRKWRKACPRPPLVSRWAPMVYHRINWFTGVPYGEDGRKPVQDLLWYPCEHPWYTTW